MGADEKEAIRVQRVMLMTVRKLTKKSLSVKAGRVHLPRSCRAILAVYLGFQMFSGIDHIENPDEDGIFKIVNDIPEKAGTIRLMMNSVISIIYGGEYRFSQSCRDGRD